MPKPNDLTSSAVDSHARTSATPAGEKESMEIDPAYGPNSLGCFACFDRESSSWKTYQLSLFEDSIEYSETFPLSGTMRNGRCFARPTLERPIFGDVSSFWHTPCARDHKGYTKRDSESICNQLRAIDGSTGKPNPRWIEWLMGFREKWTSLNASETPSCRRKRQQHSSD